jgi:hypothetical protein
MLTTFGMYWASPQTLAAARSRAKECVAIRPRRGEAWLRFYKGAVIFIRAVVLIGGETLVRRDGGGRGD